MSYSCDQCQREIKLDVLVDSDLWSHSSPTKDEGGLLCAACIADAIADRSPTERRWACGRLIPGHI